jgi:hypothetical protein
VTFGRVDASLTPIGLNNQTNGSKCPCQQCRGRGACSDECPKVPRGEVDGEMKNFVRRTP